MAKNLLEFDAHQLARIISGGQVGADRGALDAAFKFGISTGGYMPKGCRTSYGPDEYLKTLGLVETQSAGYPDRTRMNVEASDGTVAIASNFNSPGEILTSKCCAQLKKPLLQLSAALAASDSGVNQIVKFIISNNIRILNVAGNRDYRESIKPSMHYDAAYYAISHTLLLLEKLSKGN